MDSCGLSLDYAIAASRKLLLDSPERPNTVVICKPSPRPWILHRPDLESREETTRSLVSQRPVRPPPETPILPLQILTRPSPFICSISSSLPTISSRASSTPRFAGVFLEDHTKDLVPNVSFMSETGVPEKCIQLLLTHFPEAVMQKKQDFRAITKQAKEMGFDRPKKSTFVLAIHALSGKGTKSIWDKCFQVGRRHLVRIQEDRQNNGDESGGAKIDGTMSRRTLVQPREEDYPKMLRCLHQRGW